MALAYRLAEFADVVDPYGFKDAFDTMEEAVTAFADRLEDDREGLAEWLASFLDEEDSIATEAAALIADITERRAVA